MQYVNLACISYKFGFPIKIIFKYNFDRITVTNVLSRITVHGSKKWRDFKDNETYMYKASLIDSSKIDVFFKTKLCHLQRYTTSIFSSQGAVGKY